MRFVIKLGTSLLTNDENRLDDIFLQNIVDQAAQIKRQNHGIVIVSSGAVACGRAEVSFATKNKNIPFRQALAAVGQAALMQNYRGLFGHYDMAVGQALLTNYDFINRENFLNTKNVFQLMLGKGIIPIVNENDVTTIAELKFGDNDMLSAKTAAMVGADLLIILTDVNGLYSKDPKIHPDAKLLPTVGKIDDSVRRLAAGPASESSLGGMVTKLEAADYVTSAGIPMFIANGKRERILQEIVKFFMNSGNDFAQNLGTFFPSVVCRVDSQKKWLSPKMRKDAWLEVDAGAAEAMTKSGKSLLPKGVIAAHGNFFRGDVITIKTRSKDPQKFINIGYGQVNYDAGDIDKIKGRHSDEIAAILGYGFDDVVIHRNHMVIPR